MNIEKKLGIIGLGNMGEAMISGIIKSGEIKPEDIYCYDIDSEKLSGVHNKYEIKIEDNILNLLNKTDIIILAVKPQNIKKILSVMAGTAEYKNYIVKRKIIVSIAAGISIRLIESVLYDNIDDESKKNVPIIRIMPNTPSLVLSGISAITPNRYASDKDMKIIFDIMNTVGETVEIEEKYMDAVTAVSGCGPAYLFYLVEAMTDAGIDLEIAPEKAFKLSLAAVKGAVELLEKTGESPEALRKKVTSPKGATEAAFKIFEDYDVKENIMEGIRAAKERSYEIGKTIF